MRRLCTDVTADGVKAGEDWPTCADQANCLANGCFWRRFHQLPADKFRAKPTPAQNELFSNEGKLTCTSP